MVQGDNTTDKPRLLLVGNFLSTVGLNRGVCEDLAERLQAAGWQVITTSGKPGRLARLADMVSTAWRRRREYDAAYVEVYSGPAFLWVEAVCAVLRQARKPYVLTLHGGNLPAFSRRWPGRVQRLLCSAAVVTTPSRYIRAAFQSFREDIVYLPNGLDIRHYSFRTRTHPTPTLIWLRALHHIYQPELAVQVLALIRDEFPDALLWMIGPDKGDGTRDKCQELASQLGILYQLHLVGRVPKGQVPEWLDRGDIFLNTTRFESFGVSVMEAAACGLPIVSTNVGELPWLWEHERDALLVPAGDAEAMAEAVRRVLAEPGLAERLSRNARSKAEGFDWSVVLPAWENIFSEIIL